MTYHFIIIIEGTSEDKESVENFRENITSEVWHEHCIIGDVHFKEVVQ